MPNKPQTQSAVSSEQFYDAYARSYSTYLDRHRRYFDSVEAIIFDATVGRGTVSLLDVGTGTGERLSRLVSEIRPNRVVAIDESPEMATLARTNCPSAEVLTMPLAGPEFAAAVSGQFDLVTCLSNVLGHVPADQLLSGLQQIESVLRPGGVFIFDVNNRYNAVNYGTLRVIRNRLRDSIFRGNGEFVATHGKGADEVRTPVHLFTRAEVVSLLRSAGFAIEMIAFRNYETGRKTCQFGGSMVVKAVRG